MDASNLSAFGTGQLTNQGQTEQLNSSLTDYQQSHPFNNQVYLYLLSKLKVLVELYLYARTCWCKFKPAELRSHYDNQRGKLRRSDPNRLATRIQPAILSAARFADSEVELLWIADAKRRLDGNGPSRLGESSLQLSCLWKWLDFYARDDIVQHFNSYFYNQRKLLNHHDLFLFSIFKGQYVRIGVIVATMFGQKCQKCMEDRFETAMWYPEEVTKVLSSYKLKNSVHCKGASQLIRPRPPPFLRRHRSHPPAARRPPIWEPAKPTSAWTLPSLQKREMQNEMIWFILTSFENIFYLCITFDLLNQTVT